MSRIGVWAVALGLLGASAGAEGLSFKVEPGAGTTAIQKVVDGAAGQPGPAVVVFPKGEYRLDTTLWIRKPVILRGQGEETKLLIVKPLPVDLVDVRAALRVEGVMGEPSVTIENLSIVGTRPHDVDTPGQEGGSTAVLVRHCRGVRVAGLRITNVSTGIACHGSKSCVLENNHLQLVNWGISATPADTKVDSAAHVIRGNKMTPYAAGGIGLWKIDGCQVLGNYCQGRDKRTGGAIFMTSCSDTVIRDNIVNHCENGIQFVVHEGRPSDRNVIENNVVYDCHPLYPTGSGLSLQADYDGAFRKNVFRGNTVFDCDVALALSQPNPKFRGPSFDTLVENNTFRDGCLYIAGAKKTTIRNNRVLAGTIVLTGANNGDPATGTVVRDNFIYRSSGWGLTVGPGSDNNTITGNILKDNGAGGIQLENTSGNVVTGNTIHETRAFSQGIRGVRVAGGGGNTVENNQYLWQRD